MVKVVGAEGGFLTLGGEGARRCGDTPAGGGEKLGIVGFSFGEGGGRGKGGGGWIVLGCVGVSFFKGPRRLWSTSSRLMSSRSVVARWRPPGKRFTLVSEAGERGGESLKPQRYEKKLFYGQIHRPAYRDSCHLNIEGKSHLGAIISVPLGTHSPHRRSAPTESDKGAPPSAALSLTPQGLPSPSLKPGTGPRPRRVR